MLRFLIPAALLLATLASPALAASPEELRLLGSDDEEAQFESYLPYVKRFSAQGVVTGSLAQSAEDAGAPPAAMVEALRAFATAIDLERDVSPGDRFFVRYEGVFTAEGNPTGIGRVLWVELQLAKRKEPVAIHRFRPARAPRDSFFLSTGESTEAAAIRLPLDEITVTSGFGLRADPLDQPAGRALAMGPLVDYLSAPPTGPNAPLAAYAFKFAPPKRRTYYSAYQPLTMHSGVDLMARPGTPILAAGDGLVIGAQPKGPYGNWIEIEHEGKLSTVYGHLSAYAPGIEPGVTVHQGQVIGFTGNTGRSTGPHLHFELLVNGKPTNPIISQALRRGRLSGPDMERFTRVMANDRAEVADK